MIGIKKVLELLYSDRKVGSDKGQVAQKVSQAKRTGREGSKARVFNIGMK